MGIKLEKYRKLVMIAGSEPLSLVAIACKGGIREHYASTRGDFDLGHCALEAAIRKLPQVEMIVIMAVRSGETNRVIAERLHVTESRVRQIKTRAISHLRIALGVRPFSAL
jgi:DNA-binding NarL/FixJ family response regulator